MLNSRPMMSPRLCTQALRVGGVAEKVIFLGSSAHESVAERQGQKKSRKAALFRGSGAND